MTIVIFCLILCSFSVYFVGISSGLIWAPLSSLYSPHTYFKLNLHIQFIYSPKIQIHISNCLPDISTQKGQCSLKFNKCKKRFVEFPIHQTEFFSFFFLSSLTLFGITVHSPWLIKQKLIYFLHYFYLLGRSVKSTSKIRLP